MNQVIHGDALKVAPTLPAGSIDLVYLDPPFFSGRVRKHRIGPAYDDRWPGGLAAYLAFLRSLLESAKPLLAPNGLIALHLDWRAAHWGRVELERLFCASAFVNEIIWSYRTGGTSKRWLGRKHDSIHVFANGPKHVFNAGKEKSYLAHRYGFTNVRIRDDGDGPYTLVGMRDVWEIPALRGNMNEYTGYPTQKPLALLERLIGCFSVPGAAVADLCCGCGTTLLAAKRLKRNWIGVDISADAVKLARRRLSH
jgi:DNA modification methylase